VNTMQGAYVHGPSIMSYRFGNHLIDLTNDDSSFEFAAGMVYQGNVNTVDVSKGGHPAYTITDALFRIEDLFADAQDGKLDTTPGQIFSGADTIIGSSAGDKLFGFAGPDVIKGKGGNDQINGGGSGDEIHGGKGHNTLTGAGGPDIFFFDQKLGTSVDRVKDFHRGSDLILLDNLNIFKQLDATGGTLHAKNFRVGTHAHDGNDYVIYDQHTGTLYYDKDGKGGHDQVKIATFDHNPHLSVDDFVLLFGFI
jgi:Ca2+-binding RTX toxin-like protein